MREGWYEIVVIVGGVQERVLSAYLSEDYDDAEVERFIEGRMPHLKGKEYEWVVQK